VPRTRANTVRIIGGSWRSRLLEFPDVAGLRPTPDRVRETLFNWLGRDLSGMSCVDLFAGSGALGFEALSRGAAAVAMVEKNPAAWRALGENARRLDAKNLSLFRGDALEFVRGTRSRFDVAFVDPPYRLGLQPIVLAELRKILSEGGKAYVESDAILDPPSGWSILKRGRAGNVHFQLLRRDSDDQGGVSGNV
jgi:16S rRNA (guanine966-N2)-methyltransferase